MQLAKVFLTVIFASFIAFGQTETQSAPPAPSGFLKNLTIESFGYGASPVAPGYEFGTSSTSGFYNLHQLTCPLCIVGPPAGRTRAVLPPFGAKATYGLWNGRLVLFAAFGGIDNVPLDNSLHLNPNPRRLKGSPIRESSFNDDWITTADVGAHVSLDPHKEISVGITRSYVQEFGPMQGRWTKTTGDVTLTPGLVRELGRGIKRLDKRSTDPYSSQPSSEQH